MSESVVEDEAKKEDWDLYGATTACEVEQKIFERRPASCRLSIGQ